MFLVLRRLFLGDVLRFGFFYIIFRGFSFIGVVFISIFRGVFVVFRKSLFSEM